VGLELELQGMEGQVGRPPNINRHLTPLSPDLRDREEAERRSKYVFVTGEPERHSKPSSLRSVSLRHSACDSHE
jgi:hypothetical protein